MAKSNRWKKSFFVDLPHYQHHPHHQSCWRKNLGLEVVILMNVAKVGVARRAPCLQKRDISPRPCLNPLQFLVFDSETADEPVLHEKSQVPFMKTVGLVLRGTTNFLLT